MSDLAEWLLARIAEQEGAAMGWEHSTELVKGSPLGDWVVRVRDHFLADCEVKRRLVTLHHDIPGTELCNECSENERSTTTCCIKRTVALSFADLPGFRQEWRP